MSRELESLVRNTRRKFWLETITPANGFHRGDLLKITTYNEKYNETPFSETLKLDYVDDSHINGETERGIHVGTPTCHVRNVEVIKEMN